MPITAGSGMKKISSFFKNLPLREWPSTVFRLKQGYSQPVTDSRLMEGKLSIGVFSPSSISFNDNANHYKKISLFEASQRFAANLKGICK